MYTAKIISSQKIEGGLFLEVTVEIYKDGILFSSLPFKISSLEELRRIVGNQIQRYQNIDSAADEILPGDLDLTLTPISKSAENQNAYFKALLRQQEIQKLVDLKIIAPDDGLVTDGENDIKAKFDSKYLP